MDGYRCPEVAKKNDIEFLEEPFVDAFCTSINPYLVVASPKRPLPTHLRFEIEMASRNEGEWRISSSDKTCTLAVLAKRSPSDTFLFERGPESRDIELLD